MSLAQQALRQASPLGRQMLPYIARGRDRAENQLQAFRHLTPPYLARGRDMATNQLQACRDVSGSCCNMGPIRSAYDRERVLGVSEQEC
jgi:hypothetical protein